MADATASAPTESAPASHGTYTVDALAGVKYALTENAAVRVDLLGSWLPQAAMKPYQTLRAGFVLYRHPNVSRTIELPGRVVMVDAPPVARPRGYSRCNACCVSCGRMPATRRGRLRPVIKQAETVRLKRSG